MGFLDCPCCWPLGRTNWAPVLDRCQRLGHFTGLTVSLGLASGPARLFFKPYQLPPSPWVRQACARDVSFLKSGETSTCLLRADLVRACKTREISNFWKKRQNRNFGQKSEIYSLDLG